MAEPGILDPTTDKENVAEGKMEGNEERDTKVLIESGLPPSFLNDSSPLLWQKFERKFQSEKAAGSVSKSTQFEYAWCLVRSKYNDDIRKGLALLEGEVLSWLPSPPLPSPSTTTGLFHSLHLKDWDPFRTWDLKVPVTSQLFSSKLTAKKGYA